MIGGFCKTTFSQILNRNGRPDHEQQHGYHNDRKVKPEAATAVVELLMMGVRTPEICWAVNKRQDNKPEKLLQLVGDLCELNNMKECYKLGNLENLLCRMDLFRAWPCYSSDFILRLLTAEVRVQTKVSSCGI